MALVFRPKEHIGRIKGGFHVFLQSPADTQDTKLWEGVCKDFRLELEKAGILPEVTKQ